MRLPQWLRKLSPAEMLAKQLDDAQRSRIEHAADAERYAYHVTMLDARIARIRSELKAITATPTNEEQE